MITEDPYNTWARAFADECARMSNGDLDPHQAWDLADELYAQNPNRDPVEVAREAWDDEG
ncbi:hypothetical protein J7E70_02370 [Variovorax paradoxus]|nr:hypothetical protein [Variovorax paradoxus]MBT2299298.1 hypothetical protein [Variovorax paradoxus]